MIDIRLPGVDAIRRTMLRMVPDLSREVTAATAQQIYEQARAGADTHTKTGALVRSLKIKKTEGGRYAVEHDLQMAPHALFVHWGTKPHTIPKQPDTRSVKKVLRWAGPNGFVFAKIVHHPGYKGDPYLVRARTAIAQRFSTIAREAWANIARRFTS
jgi:hypothetical protein